MLLQKKLGRFPLGIWIGLIALLFSLLAWVMQLVSLFDWEGAVGLGLQEYVFSGDAVERALAKVEWGIAWADMVWPLPLTLIGFIGIWRKHFIGFTSAMMNFAICVYFPLLYAFRWWDTKFDTALAAIVLFAIPAVLGIVGLWINRRNFIMAT